MSSSRKTSYVYYERKVRDDQEIQSLLFDDDDNDEDEEPSNDRWVVQKSSKSPSRTAVTHSSRSNEDTSHSKFKENGKVSPLKIKRKLSYAVNKVETPKKRPDIVSPILIKRIPECDLSTNATSPVLYTTLPTINLLTSDEDDNDGLLEKPDRKHSKNGHRSLTNKRPSTEESKTPRSKKTAKSNNDSDDSDFELRTPSKHKKAHGKIKVASKDDEEVQTPSMKRLSGGKNNETVETNKDCTPSKRRKSKLIPRIDPDEEPTDTECVLPLSSRIRQNKAEKNEAASSFVGLPLSSKVRQSLQNKENLIFKTPEKSLESKLSRVFVALDRLSLPESPSSSRKNLGGDGARKIKSTPTKQTPSKSEALKCAMAISKADMTPIKGITPGKSNAVSSSMTPTKGTTPSKSPAKPYQTVDSSEDEGETAKPSRSSRARRKAVTSSEDESETAKPSRSSRARKKAVTSSEEESETAKPSRSSRARKKAVTSSEDESEAVKPSRKSRARRAAVTLSDDEDEAVKPCRTSRARKKVVTSSEDEDDVAKPSTRRSSRARKTMVTSSEDEDEPPKPRTSRARKKTFNSSEDEDEPATPSRSCRARKSKVSPKESPARSLRRRDQIKKTERYIVGIPATSMTPRRSARFSMSPSTPSLRQKVLMANTPRSSLPPLKDEDESEDEFLTPSKTPKSAKKKLDMTPTTPSSSRKVGHGFLSPVVADREGRAPATPSSALGIARAQLQVSTLPTSLPCREKEFNDIKSFITRKLQDGTGGCMYISGVPGTGKTATVHTVVKTLQKMAEDHEVTQFDFVEVNGLRMTEPRQAYVRIWQILSKNKATADQALKHLENKFLGKPKRCTVLLVDELDYLCNRRQDVIYNILDWTTKRYSKFIVLTIANTMDLPERTLKGKVTSRMGLTRLVFQPYTYQQLEEIVLNRLDGCKAFHADAVQLVARKVAAVSGDARRALDICRRSTEILELEGRSAVSVLDIQKVLTQIFAGSRVQAINCAEQNLKLKLIPESDNIPNADITYVCLVIYSVCCTHPTGWVVGLIRDNGVAPTRNLFLTQFRVVMKCLRLTRNSSLMSKLVLRAIRDEVLRTGVEETIVAYIHPQLVSICALEGKREPSVTDILTICTNLADSGLIFAEKGRKDINRKISLNISTDDIHYAIDC